MRRLPWLLALVACSTTDPTPPGAEVTGIWQVTAVNGVALPAPTQSGETFLAGYLTLYRGSTGSTIGSKVQVCVDDGFGSEAISHFLGWGTGDGVLLTLTYPEASGAFFPVDTAIVSGESMHWRANGAEARLGTSEWDLIRINSDQNADAPNACP